MRVEGLSDVWTGAEGNGGRWASINRPDAAPRFERALLEGRHRFQLYSLATPNGVKVGVMFEELLAAGHAAEYDAWRIDISAGDQFGSGFTALNPNQKIPALLDRAAPGGPLRLFESGRILLHLAEAFGAFMPTDPAERAETLNWLFWQMGAAPLLGGGFGHFYAYAPEKFDYALDRYAMEAKRQLDLLNRTLAERPFIAGDAYTIADIAIWPWYGALALGRSYEGADRFLATRDYTHLMRWAEAIAQRPAVVRGRLVNRSEEEGGVPERHEAGDIDRVLNGAREEAPAS